MQRLKLSYPITKDRLKTVDLKKEVDEEQKRKFLDKYVEEHVDHIVWNVINSQNDASKMYRFTFRYEYRSGLLLSEMNAMFQGASRVTDIGEYTGLTAKFPVSLYTYKISEDECKRTLERIVEGLEAVFPDCLIRLDLTRADIKIDWN
jgi:hypothetical protein